MYLLRDLLLAGSETTATMLQWGMVIMANNPVVQRRIRDDINSIHEDGSRFLTFDDRSKVPYVEAAILELLRLKAALPLALKHVTTCDTEVGSILHS